RRGMYVYYKRTLPHPDLDTFDCPDSNVAAMRREISNTPLQALATLNNEVHAGATRAFARRILLTGSDRDRIDGVFRIALSRPPTVAEHERFHALLESARGWYDEHGDDARPITGRDGSAVWLREEAAWIATLSVLLNLDEFLTRE